MEKSQKDRDIQERFDAPGIPTPTGCKCGLRTKDGTFEAIGILVTFVLSCLGIVKILEAMGK